MPDRGITFSGSGYAQLWELCRTAGILVLADVHTHPQDWVRQSRIDAANPMIAQRGHVAVIVPNYAQGAPTLAACGVFLYRGDKQWEPLPAEPRTESWILVMPMTLLERAGWACDRLRMWSTRRAVPNAKEQS